MQTKRVPIMNPSPTLILKGAQKAYMGYRAAKPALAKMHTFVQGGRAALASERQSRKTTAGGSNGGNARPNPTKTKRKKMKLVVRKANGRFAKRKVARRTARRVVKAARRRSGRKSMITRAKRARRSVAVVVVAAKKRRAKRRSSALSRAGHSVSRPRGARKFRPVVYYRKGKGLWARRGSLVKGRRVNGPVSALKAAFSKQMLLTAAATAAGYLAGKLLNRKIAELAGQQATLAPAAKWSGAVTMLIAGVVAAKTTKPLVRSAAIGVAASGLECVLRVALPGTFAKLEGEGLVPAEALAGEAYQMGAAYQMGELVDVGDDDEDY